MSEYLRKHSRSTSRSTSRSVTKSASREERDIGGDINIESIESQCMLVKVIAPKCQKGDGISEKVIANFVGGNIKQIIKRQGKSERWRWSFYIKFENAQFAKNCYNKVRSQKFLGGGYELIADPIKQDDWDRFFPDFTNFMINY